MAEGAITGQQRLEIEVKLDTKGLKRGTAEYRKALLRMTRATKKANVAQQKLAKGSEHLRNNNRGASAAIIELGRGASDARFGFHGLGNNLERATELMGSLIKKNGGLKGAFKALGASLLGPAGIVVGITVLIAYGPQLIKFFKNWANSANEAEEAQKKLNKQVEEGTITAADYLEQKAILAQDDIKRITKELDKIQRIKENENALGQTLSKEYRDQKKLLEAQLATALAIEKSYAESGQITLEEVERQAKIARALRERLAMIKKLKSEEDIKFAPVKSGNEQYFEDNETTLYDAFDINPNEPKVIDVSNVLVLDEEDYDLFGEWADKQVPKIDAAAKKLNQALQTALSGAFVGLGNAIGDALVGEGDFGDKFLKVLGGFMQAFGSAIIGVGVAALELEVALTTGQAWLAIGAGVALVAAGAVLSGISSKGVDGQGGGTRSTPTATTTTPNSVQGAGGDGTLVATVRGQDLRFILQGADDSYGALS